MVMYKHDIFISYSRRDKAKVDKVIEILVNNGYSVWIDVEGIESGEAFRQNIVEAIENSSIVIFFSSKASNKSKWTTKEISLAVEFTKYIIPIKFDNTRYNKSILFDLIDLDYIDMSEDRLMDASIKKLLKTVRSKIGERNPLEVGTGKEYEQSTVSKPKREPVDFDIRKLKESIINCWRSRSNIVNLILCLLALLAFVGFSSVTTDYGFLLWPASFLGLYGVLLLFCNKEIGATWIAWAAILWTLAEAYVMAPSEQVHRFYLDDNYFAVLVPGGILLLAKLVLFISKNGIEWWRRCKKMGVRGEILYVVAGILYVAIGIYDMEAEHGLPPNVRHFINQLFG